MSSLFEEFVIQFKKLLELEKQCEVNELEHLLSTLPHSELERRGIAVRHLELSEVSTGLGGHLLLTFHSTPSDIQDHIRESKFGSGDIVSIIPENVTTPETNAEHTQRNERRFETGIVYRVLPNKVQVALRRTTTTTEGDESLCTPVADNSRGLLYTLTLLTNEVTYKRMNAILTRLQRNDVGPATRVLNVLFGVSTPSHVSLDAPFVPLNPTLNQSQREAVSFALASQDVALIHGPPGTGKTTTVVEVIEQTVRRGGRVLVTAPSNVAVDNITERLAKSFISGLRFVRIGHPARLLPTVLSHSLESLLAESNAHDVCADIKREMESLLQSLKDGSCARHERKLKWEMWRTLRRELKQRERNAVADLIRQCSVVLTTCVGAGDRYLQHENDFELVVIDEATQATQPQALIPILKGRRLLLAGDHNQLPPTIHSLEAQQRGLGTTFFEKVITRYGEQVSRMLTVQYRMHEHIMQWASRELYENKLQADASVATHLLSHLPGAHTDDNTVHPIVFVDTAGCGLGEMYVEDGESKANEGEADVVREWIRLLVTQSGIAPDNIAVITPYLQQVNLLRRLLWPSWPAIEINTVDSFQGREKECIILSLVRSNRAHEVGFLKDERRLNVAVTRARRQCTIIGDSETLSSHPFLYRLISYFQQHGEYWSAQQFLPNITHYSVTRDDMTFTTTKALQRTSKIKDKKRRDPQNNANNTNAHSKHNTNDSNTESKQKKANPNITSHTVTGALKEDINILEDTKQECEQENETIPAAHCQLSNETKRRQPQSPARSTPRTSIRRHAKKQINITTTNESRLENDSPKVSNEKELFRSLTNDDAVLEEVLKYKNMCHFPGCKEWTIHVVGGVCQFCKEKFCYKHAQYEVHGCGPAAQQKARMERHRELEAITNARAKVLADSKPFPDWKRQALTQRLHKKIQEQKGNRTKKPKNKSPAKK